MAKKEALPEKRDAQDADDAVALGHARAELACVFAGFRLESDGTLWRGDAVVHLPPKELTALRLLIEHAGRIVSPVQLKHALWGDVHVTADSVPKCLSSLRARLEPQECIQTVYKRGYRLTATVRRPGGGTTGTPLRLAILPFATRYTVPEHLGQAIAEETIASLGTEVGRSRFTPLQTGVLQGAVAVLARDSVFNLAQRGLSAVEVGQKLHADLALTGTLQAFSSHYRLRAEMIRVADGTQMWVEDILSPQNRTEELESELLRRLAFRLGSDGSAMPAWKDAMPVRGAFHPPAAAPVLQLAASAADETEHGADARRSQARAIFLRGHHEWQTLHRHRMQDGQQHLLRAIELDPTLIAAKVDLAHLCVAQAFYGFMSPAVAADRVHRLAESISDLSQYAATLLPALGWINFHFDRNLADALLAFSYSAHLGHDPWTTRTRAMFALSRHCFAEAIALLGAAIETDPFSPWLHNRLAWALHLDGQAGASVEQVRKNILNFPDHEGTGIYGAAILAFNGEPGCAIDLTAALAQRQPFFDLASSAHAYVLACAGREDEARVLLERLQWLGRERFIGRGFLPAAYAALGETELALAELRALNEVRCPWFFQMLADPRLKPLHGHQEFEQMRSILPAMEADARSILELED